MKVNFILQPDRSGIIESSLRQCAPEFFDSKEYASIARNPKLASMVGLLCAAFTSFLCRKIEGGADRSETQTYFDLIESWVKTQDSAVVNYVITEIFENVRLLVDASAFKQRLGPAAHKLHEKWIIDERSI